MDLLQRPPKVARGTSRPERAPGALHGVCLRAAVADEAMRRAGWFVQARAKSKIPADEPIGRERESPNLHSESLRKRTDTTHRAPCESKPAQATEVERIAKRVFFPRRIASESVSRGGAPYRAPLTRAVAKRKAAAGGPAAAVTRRAFRDFAAEEVSPAWSRPARTRRGGSQEEETFPARVERDAHEPRRDTRAKRVKRVSESEASFASSGATASSSADEQRRDGGAAGTKKRKKTSLLDLPDELLAACVQDLPLDTLAVAATVTGRLAKAALRAFSFAARGDARAEQQVAAAGAARGAGDDLEP